MTSMIDVVFLLLIFFLVTTTFIKPERQVSSSIKVEETATAASVSDLEPAVIEVFVLGESVAFRLGAITTTDLTQLKKPLNLFENKVDGAFIRVSGDVPFEYAAKAIGLCKSVGFEQVAYVPAE